MSKVSTIWILSIVVTVFTSVSCHQQTHRGNTAHKPHCQSLLRSLGAMVKQYSLDNEGKYPARLEDALADLGFGKEPWVRTTYRCPGFRSSGPNTNELVDDLGFIFIDWSDSFRGVKDVPESYPIMYDARLSNHGGLGVNVCLFGGRIFWDVEGKWINQFATNNSKFRIPIPAK